MQFGTRRRDVRMLTWSSNAGAGASDVARRRVLEARLLPLQRRERRRREPLLRRVARVDRQLPQTLRHTNARS